jgi:hypothetical protein
MAIPFNEFISRLRARLPTDTLLARDKDDKLIIVFPGIKWIPSAIRACPMATSVLRLPSWYW